MRSNLSLEGTGLCTIPVTLVKDPIVKRLPKVSQNYATVSEMSERAHPWLLRGFYRQQDPDLCGVCRRISGDSRDWGSVASLSRQLASLEGTPVGLLHHSLVQRASKPHDEEAHKTKNSFSPHFAVYFIRHIVYHDTTWRFGKFSSTLSPFFGVLAISRSRQPRHHPVHVYRQSVNLGQTQLTERGGGKWRFVDLLTGHLL